MGWLFPLPPNAVFLTVLLQCVVSINFTVSQCQAKPEQFTGYGKCLSCLEHTCMELWSPKKSTASNNVATCSPRYQILLYSEE